MRYRLGLGLKMRNICSAGVILLLAVSFFPLHPLDARPENDLIPTTPKGIVFVENLGQFQGGLDLFAVTPFGTAGFGKGEIYYDIKGDGRGAVVRIGFGTDAVPEGIDDLGYPSNYFLGNDPERWVIGARSYSRIKYEEVWPGIDIVFGSGRGSLKYDLILAPGADPDDIRFRVDGALGIRSSGDGLRMDTAAGPLFDSGLIAYHTTGGRIECGFETMEDGSFGFRLSEYDRTKEIVIDPFVSSIIIGGSEKEETMGGLALDADGNIFMAGSTTSIDFPVTPGAYDTSLDAEDAFVMMLDQNASRVLFATYIGGSGGEILKSVDIGPEGNIYVTGWTGSLDYPTTANAISGSLSGTDDGIVSALDPTGSSLLFSTYIGGASLDSVHYVTASSDGIIYVAGETYSNGFTTTEGAFQGNFGGLSDAFVMKMDTTTGDLIYSTLIGGDLWDGIHDMIVDEQGWVYVCGGTYSSNFPTTPGAYSRSRKGETDAFVLILNENGSDIIHSTLVGGSTHDRFYGIRMDMEGNIIVSGHAEDSDYPTTPGAFDRTYAGGGDIVVTILDPELSSILFSTYAGGAGREAVEAIDIDSLGNIYLCGFTDSDDLPTTYGEYDTYGGNRDAFFMVFEPSLGSLKRSTYIGGSDIDEAKHVTLDGYGSVMVAGFTQSIDFPVTGSGFGPGGGRDLFLSVFRDEIGTNPIRFDPAIPRTGEELRISLDAVDIDPDTALFHYSVDDGPLSTIEAIKVGEGRFRLRFDVPNDAVLIDHYHEYLIAGNVVRRSSVEMLPVIDDEPPILVADRSDRIASMGSHYAFEFTVSDNVGISSASVEYHLDDGTPKTMALTGKDELSGSITIPYAARTLAYRLIASDAWGNHARVDTIRVEVVPPSYELIYSAYMDDDPEWRKEGDGFFWSGSSYRIEGGYGYAGADVDGIEGSFVLEYDIGIDVLEMGSSLSFGLRDADMSGAGQMAEIAFGSGSFTDYVELRTIDVNGKSKEVRAALDIPEGELYRCRIRYDPQVEALYGTVIMLDGFTEASSLVIEDVKAFDDLSTVCSSNLGSDATGESSGRIDDVLLFKERRTALIARDLGPDNATTGDPVYLSALLSDPARISSAVLEYGFDDGTPMRTALVVDQVVGLNIAVPSNALEISYRFLVTDLYGIGDASALRAIPVMDNDPPEIIEDRTAEMAQAGSNLSISVMVEDNIGVEEVWVEYSIDGSAPSIVALSGDREFYGQIRVQGGSLLRYSVHARDTSGNVGKGPLRTLEIIDVHPPFLSRDRTPVKGVVGEVFRFEIEANDNSGAFTSWVDLSLGGRDRQRIIMDGEGGIRFAEVSIYASLARSINYTIFISDMSGNSISIGPKFATLENPFINALPSGSVMLYEGENLEDLMRLPPFVVTSSLSHIRGGRIVQGVPPDPGLYTMHVRLTDVYGIEHSFSLQMTLLPEEHDSDGDGMPDLWERRYGLDPLDPLDGLEDPDEDDLTNYQEYLNGTDPFDPDTDKDGMPDGWEVRYGLDPLRFSALDDTDGDGRTDLEEYLSGSDPTVRDVERSRGIRISFTVVVIVALLFLILIAVVMSLAMSLGKVSRRIVDPNGEGEMVLENGDNGIAQNGVRYMDPMDPMNMGLPIPDVEEEAIQSDVEDGEINGRKPPQKRYPVYVL